MEIVKLPNGTETVVAEYREQIIQDYAGNPYIECLPEILSPQQVIEHLAYYPSFDSNERLLEPYMRVHLLQRLNQFFQPLEEHIRLESAISTMLRNGYLDRNPFSSSYIRKLTSGDGVSDGSIKYQSSSAKSLTLVGISGSGKSSSLAKILSLTPQLIVHSKYRGRDFSRYQVSHLRIEAPYDGSLKALCLQFFMTIDSLLGTNYMDKYGSGNKSTNVMIPIISRLLQNLGVGLLCIDEIQHLSMSRSGGRSAVLNFFTTLINTANIPIILVGTPKSLNILQNEFRQARRGLNGQGSFFWDRLKKDATWGLFLNGIWKYQWVRNSVELTDEISDILYEETQGIPDITVKLFMMTQVRAISSGKETFNGAFIRKVAKDQLTLIRPMIDGLRSGRKSQLVDYQDIIMPDMVEFIQKEQSQIQVKSFIQEAQKRTESRGQQIRHLKEEAIVRLQLLGMAEKQAGSLVNEAIANQPSIVELNALVQSAYQLSMIDPNEKEIKKKGLKISNEGDLRVIVSKGKAMDISAYEALKQAGMIRNDFGNVG